MIKYLKPLQFYQESLKRIFVTPPTVFLGLNVSDQFVSVATSDSKKLYACEVGFCMRDERILDKLVNEVQNRDPPVDVHTLINDICKKGKFENLKYTYWKDNTTSERADFGCNELIHQLHDLERAIGIPPPGPPFDMVSARHMLQASLDVFNTLVERKKYGFDVKMGGDGGFRINGGGFCTIVSSRIHVGG
ncbi:hypothetical protein EZV62_015424 [Acer yangbiense]|uniref:Uncharacterized protein n=1 Tax=Acer yangbiense TaxID=1000413 RepID=A0A5C7HLD0_9ROSI|nr:hypothetical protein EZV62_015424 [Acer yangbiense]